MGWRRLKSGVPVSGSTQAPPPAPPLRYLRIGLDVVIGLLLVLLLLAAAAWAWVRFAQPGFDGSLHLAGLQAPVSVVRDEWGVPHITARSVHDLYLAQGFAMAQDRLWQMDLMRRLGEGRLAEVFGPVALSADESNRRLGLGRTAAAEAARLSPDEQALLGAFAQGVNDEIAARGWRLPVEFLLLRYRPQPWQARDTLALAAYMYQQLASGYEDKLERETFLARLGPALGAQLFPQTSPWDIVPGSPPPKFPPAFRGFPAARPVGGRGRQANLPVFAAPFGPVPVRGGSNDWVLAGARSFSGLPILANDPHLPFQIPGLWWTVQLTLSGPGGFSAAGAAIVGVPGVIIGHNQDIAWGVTNTRADVQDLYRETLDGRGNVLTPAGWRPLQHWRETIAVKGAAPVTLDVQVTPHGPIVSHDAGGSLALRWSLYAPGALQSAHVFLALDRARGYADFLQAVRQFPGPAQNFVYAGRDGHIAYQCAGWVPLRRGYDGSVPVEGASGRFEWQGWIPFEALPHALDPPAGVLATANGRVTPDRDPYPVSTDWDSPNRTREIYAALSALPRWNASAMSRIQTSVYSEQDRDFAAAVVAAAAAAEARGAALDASTRQALAALRGFRGFMGHTSSGPTLAYFTRQEFLRRVLAARVGDALARQYHWDEAPVFVQWLLAAQPSAWLPAAYAPPRGGGWNALLLDSLRSVVARVTLAPSALHWGHFERLALLHPVLSHLPLLDRYADLGPVEINGSRLTIKQAQSVWLGAANDLGPSMRLVADPADWDRSTLNLVAGESGNVFSRHYHDQWDDYLAGRPVPLWFSPPAVAAHRRHSQALLPR